MDNKNLILAFSLSFVILIGWQFFIIGPQQEAERARLEAQRVEEARTNGASAPSGDSTAPVPGSNPPAPNAPVSDGVQATASRESLIAATKRVEISTPSLNGSINLTGARIDDLSLKNYYETIEEGSPEISFFSPSGSEHAFYAEFGWSAAGDLKLPNGKSEWSVVGNQTLTQNDPVTMTWYNGAGLQFTRTISLDKDYLFSIEDSVKNTGGETVTLFPYGLLSRHETPLIEGFFILHEGLIGYVEENSIEEIDYDDQAEAGKTVFNPFAGGWLGITDKYWAATLIPDKAAKVTPSFSHRFVGTRDRYQTDYLGEGVAIAAGGEAISKARLFAGAKRVNIIDGYEAAHGIDKFELLIDWGWFYFITKPMFFLLDFFFKLIGNFGLAILAATVVIKLFFFPLANRSYVSMSRMKVVQPQMMEIRERYKDDRAAQQKAMMELYKKEKINPLSGCLPILLQIPVFFALYKVLFVTIEMRHAPFYGWIQDLAAPDPTSIFNMFGLISWDPPSFLMLGVWPLIMGVTMFIQMKLNPSPPDPTQQMIFNWMPVVFTFMLATFPAGLVIYWAWNNSLSIVQQSIIMHRQGAKIEIFKNIKDTFSRSKPEAK